MERPELAGLVPEKAIKILDVGCGAGGLGRTLLRQNPSREMYGVEIVEGAAKEAAKVYKKVHVGELESIDFPYGDGFFDVIIFADVLEHLIDPWSALEGLRKYLNDDGVVISSIPNVGHWSMISALCRGEWSYVESGILDKTHLRFFTKKTIHSMYRNAGFKVNHFGGKPSGANPLRTPSFQAGVQSIGINSEQCFADSDVFQYLTVAKKSLFIDKTSIIVLAEKNTEVTAECLRALQEKTPKNLADIILVIEKGGKQYFESTFDGITVVNVDDSSSFSEKVNIATENANGKYLCILKGDILVTPRWLERQLECLTSSEDIAMVGPFSTNIEGDQNLETRPMRSEHELNSFSDRVFSALIGSYVVTRKLAPFCLLLRADKYREAGGFNSVLKNERTAVASLGNKLQENGNKLVINQDCFVYHLPFAEID